MGFFYIIDAIGESAYLDYSRSISLELLDLFGSYFVIEHMATEHEKRMNELIYRAYITDALKAMAESWGVSIMSRYVDLINREPEETKSGDDIALEVIMKAGLKVKEDDTI